MSSRLKLILVTNSVPLPDADFLKDKVFGLSENFEVHLFCWDKQSVADEFTAKYSNKLNDAKAHVYYHQLDSSTRLKLMLKVVSAIIFNPTKSIALLSRLRNSYKGNSRKVLSRFITYYPIIKLNPDIVHFEFGTLAHSFSDIKDYIKCKVSSSFRGYDLNYVGLDDSDYYTRVWDNLDGFHFLGEDLKRRAINRGYNNTGVHALIAPAVDTGLFQPKSKYATDGKLNIVSVGRLTWKKGYEFALQAMTLLKKRGIPFSYKIVGAGAHKQAIQFAISELGLNSDVELLGLLPKNEIAAVLKGADVFLHPAVSEGFSNAVIEAQAIGLPVIATSADGLSENIENGVTGLIVPVYDAEAIAEKLQWCFDNRQQLPYMGKAGVERVKRLFTIDEQIKKFEQFYNTLNEK